jgi:5-methyltetrahydrofolate--homocysteine methyltransferase
MWWPPGCHRGQEASQRFERLQAADRYSEGYFLHGLAVQMAEGSR